LNEKINGATAGSVAYTEALKTLNEAQKTEVGAIDGLRTAKEREIETTKALVKANLLLQKSRKKLTKKQIKEAEKLVDKLQTPVSVPSPTSLPSIPSFDFGNFDFSGLDLSGIDFSGIGGLAKGGIVTKPTLTWVGEGGESEAVIPLSKMGDMGGGDVYNITINSKIADATLPDVLVAELRKFNRRSGAINIQVA
jgi:type II secretory pathway pseudopilin PulG